ncbi:MAG: CoA transferase [Deltaproteobacteria bacterium]|nr:CoA transferase [Deltaproteobacteria bacterium]
MNHRRNHMARLPLEGIRVADFTWVWAGPFCTLQLAHLGAEVIRVETSTRPCITRLIPPWPNGQSTGVNSSGYFNQYNQGKRSLSLNLKKSEALELAKQLVAKSDIVTENFAGGVMDRMGLGYETLKQINPKIIMISLSGYGTTGPEKEYISYGPAQVPMSGLASLTGYKGWRPMHVGISYGDPNGGLHGAFAVMCALMYRARTGKGQYIDLSQWETSTAMVAEGLLDYSMNGGQEERDGNHDLHMSPHAVYRSAGKDRWVSLAVRNEAEWQKFCTAIGQPALANGPRFSSLQARKQHEEELDAIITTWTEQRSPEDATTQLQAAGIPSAPVMSNKDLSTDPHLNSRPIFTYPDHPEVGKKQHVGIPWQLSQTSLSVRKPAPLLGEDTEYVLRDILGYSTEQVAAFKAQDVLT